MPTREDDFSNIRYPSTLDANNVPWVTFSTHRPKYNRLGLRVDTVPTDRSVTMYMPSGYTVSDSINYESASEGLAGLLIDKFGGGSLSDISMADVAGMAAQNLGAVAGALGAGVGFVASKSAIGSAIGAVGGSALTGALQNRVRKGMQRTINPREYMLFQSPNLREFPFSFSFIPQNEQEALNAEKIVRFFRYSSYPSLSTAGYTYTFPDMFSITFGNIESLVRVPEVVCTGIEINYNPNSMSYFVRGNSPVQIDVSLSFKESKAITRENIDQGF